jgi:general stress protein 26
MDPENRHFILDVMRSHNIMTLATVRPDGFPQANTVAYANEDLNLYFTTERRSQKVRNIEYCDKVSLTIDRDYPDWRQIKGVSMAAIASMVTDPQEWARARDRLVRKFPPYANLLAGDIQADVVIMKIAPKVVSILNYEREFGHTELVEV